MREYHDLLRHVLETGEPHEDRTGVGTTSVFGHQLRLDMQKGFPLITTRKLPFRWIITELQWMLAGSTDERELSAKGVHTWAPWATAEACARHNRQPGDLGPTYGFLLRHFGSEYYPTANMRLLEKMNPGRIFGHDQLWELCSNLDTSPNSRRHLLVQWDPISTHELEVPPCHPLLQFRVHAAKQFEATEELSLHVYARSQDAFIGLPFDIAHFGLLLEMMAWCTCRRARNLILSFGDLHVYRNHTAGIDELLSREPRDLPRLIIEKDMYHAQPPAPGRDSFINLLQMKVENLRLDGYDPWPKISMALAV